MCQYKLVTQWNTHGFVTDYRVSAKIYHFGSVETGRRILYKLFSRYRKQNVPFSRRFGTNISKAVRENLFLSVWFNLLRCV